MLCQSINQLNADYFIFQLVAFGALGAGAVGYGVVTENRLKDLQNRNDDLGRRITDQDNRIKGLQGTISSQSMQINDLNNKVTALENAGGDGGDGGGGDGGI